MCRLTSYLGPPIRLASLLVDPEHSLIRQSTHSRERDEPLNGDGFGVGWYQPELSDEPAVFRSITPAWNNRNLHGMARVVASPCILAHVRAASVWSGVNEANCHPFRYQRYLFMHNGEVPDFRQLRRRLLDSVCDEAFGNVYGSTDSEHIFALVIDEMVKAKQVGDDRGLPQILHNTVWRLVDLIERLGSSEISTLNLALTDGNEVAICRMTDKPDARPESLYYLCGQQIYEPAASHTPQRRSREREDALIVASERLTSDPRWQEIPPQHILVTRRGTQPKLLRSGRNGLETVSVS